MQLDTDTEDDLREIIAESGVLPIDQREEMIESIKSESSSLAVDCCVEVSIRKLPDTDFDTSHPHMSGPGEIKLHLAPDDARTFDQQVVDPLFVSLLLDRDLSIFEEANE
jgi:hypothetical protein